MTLRKPVLAATAALILTLTIPAAAMAWPTPQPGQPACIPNGDGAFHIDPNAQPPFPRGSHQPERGRCEGPVRPAPTPIPTPSCGTTVTCPPGPAGPPGPQGPAGPAGPQGPPGETVYVPVPVPVPTERLCTSRRVITHVVRRRYPGETNTAGALVTAVRRVSTGLDHDGKRIATTVRKRADGRFVVTIRAAGHRFSGFDNELRTTVVLHTAAGNFRTIYRSAVCRSEQGNPNDQGSRAPVIPVRG